MLRNLLGEDHFMTALCLKDLGDFYFLTERTDEGRDKALNYYKEAMEVMEKLGTRNQKRKYLNSEKLWEFVTKRKAILRKQRFCFWKRIKFATMR